MSEQKGLPVVNVAAAVICDSKEKTKILATQRGIGHMKGKWEFPGGIVEKGETAEHTLVREVREELGIKLMVGKYVGTIEKDYDKFHMVLKCYYAYVESGNMILKEHLGARWLTKDELESVDWVSADATLLEHIKSDMADAQP